MNSSSDADKSSPILVRARDHGKEKILQQQVESERAEEDDEEEEGVEVESEEEKE